MNLFYGILLLSLGSLTFSVALLGCRNPKPPKWAGDFSISNIITPGICALCAMGVAKVVQFFFQVFSNGVTLLELGLSAAVAAAAVMGFKALRVKKTLAQWAEDEVIKPELEILSETEASQPPTHQRAA